MLQEPSLEGNVVEEKGVESEKSTEYEDGDEEEVKKKDEEEKKQKTDDAQEQKEKRKRQGVEQQKKMEEKLRWTCQRGTGLTDDAAEENDEVEVGNESRDQRKMTQIQKDFEEEEKEDEEAKAKGRIGGSRREGNTERNLNRYIDQYRQLCREEERRRKRREEGGRSRRGRNRSKVSEWRKK